MTTLTLAAGRPTLADRLFSRSLATDAVLIVGSALGATRGALSMVLYAALGLFLPIYSEGAHGVDALFGAPGKDGQAG